MTTFNSNEPNNTEDDSSDEYTISDELNDPDYAVCFTTGIPLGVLRLMYGLQFSTITKNVKNGDTHTITFDISPIFFDNLMETMLWETKTKSCTIGRSNNYVTITVSKDSLILQGLDHKNPSFPKEIWHYLDIRAKKEAVVVNIDVKAGK
jgi:hypothetical protein